jgi:hypothetical protein
MFLKYPLSQYICMWFRTNRSLCNQPGQGMFKEDQSNPVKPD